MDDVTHRDAGALAPVCELNAIEQTANSSQSPRGIHAGRSGSKIKLDVAQLLLIARADPPQGWTRWTLPRLAEELGSQGIVATISPEDVRLALVEAIMGKQGEGAPIEEQSQCWF
jgi:hypothetical protein